MFWSTNSLFPRLAVVFAVALMLGACGGAQPTATPRPSPTAAPTATVSPQLTPTVARTVVASPTSTVAQPTATAVSTVAPTPNPTATSKPAAPDYPNAKYGGTIIRARPADAPTWDSWKISTENVHDLLQTVYDSIAIYNPQKQDEIVPQLAESWTVSGDALTYTFKIRKGVQFHNGNALTAEDLRWSFDQMKNPPQGVPSINKGSFTSVESFAAPDDQTLVIKLKQPDAAFLAGLAFGRIHIMDKELLQAEGLERAAKWPPIGTGPFLAKPNGYIKGVSAEVVSNPAYFVKGRPFLAGSKIFVIPDLGTQFAAFLAGQINFDFRPTPLQIKEVQSKLGNRVTIQKTASTVVYNVLVDTQNPPFNNPKVREAVSLAIDREGVIQGVEQGVGLVGGLMIPQTGFALPDATLAKYAGYSGDRASNIKRAKQLLSEAGFPSGLQTKLWTRQHPAFQSRAIVVKANLDEVGIKNDIQFNDDAVYFGNQSNLDSWDIILSAVRYSGIDPNFIIGTGWVPGGPWNFAHYSDARVNELYAAQNREADPAKRKAMVNEMEERILASYTQHTLYFGVFNYSWYSNIKNFTFHVNYNGSLQMRDVWME